MILTRKRLLALTAIFLTTAALLFAFQNAVRELVILPLQYLAWFASLIYHSFDQSVIWSLLFVLALFIGVQLFYASLRPSDERPAPPNNTPLGLGRVGAWLVSVRFMLAGGPGQDYFAAEVKRLLLSILAYRESASQKEIEQRILEGSLYIPAELLFAFQSRVYRPPSLWSRVGMNLNAILASIRHQTEEPDEERRRALRVIVQFLEEQLEES